MKAIYRIALSITMLACATAAFAGGPLNTDPEGKPIVYLTSDMPIPYTVDRGNLGAYSNSEATAIVDECFAVWQAVPTASVHLANAGFLAEDITVNNIESFLNSLEGNTTNPVIFDSDGSIIDAIYGTGASNNIIGFSGSSYANDAVNGYHYTDGLSLLNGRFTRPPYDWTPSEFKATFVHEFGHFIGLDHTQINRQFVHDDNTANDIYIPTMFPTATDDDTSLASLNPDDEAALTMLYPADSAVVNAVYGKIHGTLRWQGGLPALGANVVAVKQGDDYNHYMYRFSCVSDYTMQRDGSFDMLVTPGTYDFVVEPIYPHFTGGSSVGPYATFPFSRSFIFPAKTTEYAENLTIAAGDTPEVELVVRHNLLRPFPGLGALLLEFLQSIGLLPSAG